MSRRVDCLVPAVVLSVLLSTGAMAIVWAPNPSPSGSASAAASGSEAKLLTYRITAQDRDSSTPNGLPTDTVTLAGDETVDVFPVYVGNPPSGKMVLYAQAAFDAVAGTRSYDVTVRLKLVGEEQEAVVDPYAVGDTRTAGDPRMDITAGNGGAVPLRTAINQTITINPNKADMKGKVTDAGTGMPIANARIDYYSTDPDIDEPFMGNAWTDFNGDWELTNMYAGPYDISCWALDYESQARSGQVGVGSEGTEDFSLVCEYPMMMM